MANDDDVALSESTLKALEEFYKEQEQLKSRVISEDWVFLPKYALGLSLQAITHYINIYI